MQISKNVSIKSCHIFKKNKNGHFIFGFFWIRSVQNWSNLQIQWTDISNSRIQARRAWFLVLHMYILEFGLFYDNFKKPCHCYVNKDFLLLLLDRNASLELFSTHCALKERSLIFDAQPLSHSFKIKNLRCLKHVTWLEIWDCTAVWILF